MVKQAKTPRILKKTGRPAARPEDVRSERTALRIHPDLQHELKVAARDRGMTRSLYCEQILLAAVNQRLWQRGERMLDGIGKYMSDEEMDRAHASVDASHQADYRQRTMEYGAPPVLRQGPTGGMPRWMPPAAAPTRKK